MQTSVQNTARITDIIYFHGVTLQVITYKGIRYVPAKPLIELAGNVWRRAKETIISGDNAILYGTTTIQIQNLDIESHTSVKPIDLLCLQLDRIYIYLARINTNMMKAKGNVDAANSLLRLQVEWAQVLHDYETKGIATKDKNKNDTSELMNLMKLRQMANPTEKIAFTHLLHQKMTELGLPISNQQQDLLNQ